MCPRGGGVVLNVNFKKYFFLTDLCPYTLYRKCIKFAPKKGGRPTPPTPPFLRPCSLRSKLTSDPYGTYGIYRGEYFVYMCPCVGFVKQQQQSMYVGFNKPIDLIIILTIPFRRSSYSQNNLSRIPFRRIL